MKHHFLKYAAYLLILSLSLPAQAEAIDTEKEADIKLILDMTGALSIGKQMSDAVIVQMTQKLKAARPDLPPELFDAMAEEVNQLIEENLPAFVALVVPIYDKLFTHQEIKELIAFYRTDIGMKTIRVMPILLQESMLAGRRWGQLLGPIIERRIIERFKKEGVDLSV
ncbi:DUF2059 domain-containing protein [Sedimenticola sp.]|uniref:DUF2059 domain-containing protein n=1 Tax=Sedimenticola sp. TaxID=1940285 RepID=UPI003D113BEF